jgi:hypothetical protein
MPNVTKGEKLMCLEDPAVFDDGETVAFTIKNATGKQMRVNCSLPEIGDICSFLGTVAKAAGEIRNAPTPPFPHGHNYLAPIPAQGIGFQAGANLGETILVMRLFGFDMAFSVESSGLARIADEVARIARTLSAEGKIQ